MKKLKILHTDVKLENIGINISMLSVKLLDFGLSVSYEDVLTIEKKCSGTSFFSCLSEHFFLFDFIILELFFSNLKINIRDKIIGFLKNKYFKRLHIDKIFEIELSEEYNNYVYKYHFPKDEKMRILISFVFLLLRLKCRGR